MDNSITKFLTRVLNYFNKQKKMSKTILITGASSGIGKATAKHFQAKGWNVIATMRTPENETELNTLNNVLVTKLDVTDLASITKAVNDGIQRFGKIDVLVNNAGYGAFGTLESYSRENMLRQFNTNVIGLLDVTKALLPHFRQNKSGILINLSSIAGKITLPIASLYNGTKFAVEGISESLTYEFGEFGGKVKIIEPDFIATDFTGRSFVFSNEESLAEYQPLVGKVMTALPALFNNASPASLAAEVIYTAATDGSDTLRYTVGTQADGMIEGRRQADDASFIAGMTTQLGLK